MKKLNLKTAIVGYAILFAMFSVRCSPPQPPANLKTIERVQTGDVNFSIVTIDSCQYIVYWGCGICHKGDCKNKKHCR